MALQSDSFYYIPNSNIKTGFKKSLVLFDRTGKTEWKATPEKSKWYIFNKEEVRKYIGGENIEFRHGNFVACEHYDSFVEARESAVTFKI